MSKGKEAASADDLRSFERAAVAGEPPGDYPFVDYFLEEHASEIKQDSLLLPPGPRSSWTQVCAH